MKTKKAIVKIPSNTINLEIPKGLRIMQTFTNVITKIIVNLGKDPVFISDEEFLKEWKKYVKEYNKKV